MISAFPEYLYHPPAVHPCPSHDVGPIQALFLRSVPYRGRETLVFAYYGRPPGNSGPFPAVVLLHGGGGTAFPEWIRRWNQRGYAALALDLEGHIPLRAEPAHVELTGHPFSGPARQGEFGDIDEPADDQWMYHAIAAGIAGLSFLYGQAEVDASHVGVNGISWGGIVTANLLCADTRPAFALPVYGCGFLGQGGTYFSEVFARKKVRDLWDCSGELPHCTTPTLWLNGARDFHFSPISTSRCCAALPGSLMLLLPFLEHGYDGAGWEPQELYAFADAACGRGKPFLRFAQPFTGRLTVPEGISVAGALQWTAPDGIRYPGPEHQCATVWEKQPLTFSGNRVHARRSEAGAVSFVNVSDTLGRTVSSLLFEENVQLSL